ncbi:hypothetical protein K353_04371 [Kitasatospora sp. SolWspMP-SS2h]|uniref:hypothetical protein n=1 Tax=Kitasatospora sp. SolWspMP-SS2h TaxID=1305729 RepID=UPI000DBA2939|nr:hypothetical protein [Kitasatospora sp. SolWspMP-SS2h]RAJ38434.1 hypothetical protein K353_04371 [Kitasatospora sp. SolWspMP-SS2h]
MDRSRTRPTRPTRPFLLLAVAAAAAVLLTGCGGGERDGSFDAQPGTPSPSCLPHQSREPGTRYTGGEKSDPTAVLEMMRFYTANGTKAYCDGKPPTAVDRRWTELYTGLGGDAGHVAAPPPK